MLKLSVSILFCIFIAGCSSPSSHVVTGEVRSAISPSEVVIYEVPPERYTEIAALTATSSRTKTVGGQSEIDEVMNYLKSEAASLGANGVIINFLEDEPVNINRVTTYDGNQGITRNETRFQKFAQGYAVFVE